MAKSPAFISKAARYRFVPNKYPGTCTSEKVNLKNPDGPPRICGQQVGVGEGFVRNESGWKLYCEGCIDDIVNSGH
jgi:hypothetical protein